MEHPAVAGLVGVNNNRGGLAGHGLFQGHVGGDTFGGRETVCDQGLALGAVNDDDGLVPQVGMLPHLHPGPQVGDQDAGDFSSRFPAHRRSRGVGVPPEGSSPGWAGR